MAELPFAAFDCDHHYYEAEDAFIRHMDPRMAKRAMQWATIDGKKRLLVGGRVNRFIPNPTFDPIAKPGCLDDYFRGKQAVADMRAAFGELEPLSSRPEYRDRDARVALLDAQHIASCLMFPTLGVGMESSLEHDLPAMQAAFSAFNRWLDEDWGFNYDDRIYAAPYITLSDVDHAVAELEFALSRDARVVNMRASAVTTANGQRSPGDPMFDPFWARVGEAGITVAFHAGDAAYDFMFEHWGLPTEFEAFRYDPLKRVLCYSNIADTVAAIITGGVFDRHPNVRIATIESGSDWVAGLVTRFTKAYKQARHAFGTDPVDRLRTNVWVAPYYEDDIEALADVVGISQIIFGSDYPHAEGLAVPTDFADDLAGFGADAVEAIMHDNGRALVTPRSALAA